MAVIKTELGLRAFKDRSISLSPRQRSAFILFDGHRSINDVLTTTAATGVTPEEIAFLFEVGMLAEHQAVAAVPDEPAAPAASPEQRYQVAYPIATRLTAGLGLRGFRLNLAVEAASGYEMLKELAPKIREAVGVDQFRELDRALRG